MSRVVLASTSPARLALLRQVGMEPEIVPSSVDEPAAVAQEESRIGRALTAEETVVLLADAKARATAALMVDGLVIGGDSAFWFDGRVWGKPHEPHIARERWNAHRGRSGTLFSGQCVLRVENGEIIGANLAADRAEVVFSPDIDADEIEAYLASGEPLEVAGAFTLDGLAAAFIDRIDGAPSTVIGMSIPLLRRQVRALGCSWSALAAENPLHAR